MRTILFFLIFLFSALIINAQFQNYAVQYRACDNCGGQVASPCNMSVTNDVDSVDYTYSGINSFQTSQIVSDFGPRRLSSTNTYDWHGGIDYSSAGGDADRGDLILTIRGGSLRFFFGNTTKRVIVDNPTDTFDFGYLHIFYNFNSYPVVSGECAIKYMLQPNQARLALIVPTFDAVGNVNGHRAYGQINSGQNSRVVWEGDTLEVATQIDAGRVIAPIGDSYNGNNLCAHLHLSCFPNNNYSLSDANTKDPLRFVAHEEPDYTVNIHKQQGSNPHAYPSGININYPGTLASKFLVRPSMPNEVNGVSSYNSNVMDVVNVEAKLKKSNVVGDAYKLIKGKEFESRISYSALINGAAIYPEYMHNANDQYIGGWSRQGIHPYAYADASSHPYDDHYFTDFITRIHRDDPMDGNTTPTMFAYCPQSARYNDGRYQLKAVVKDVRYVEDADDADDHIFEGPRNANGDLTPIEFVLDNFKPFIQSVHVFFDDKLVYNMSWECDDSCDGMRPNQGTVSSEELTYSDLQDTMTVIVEASEPLTELNLSIRSYGDIIQPLETIPSQVDTNGTKIWTFVADISDHIYEVPTGATGDIQLLFTGHDLHGDGQQANDLLNMSDHWFPEGEREPDTSCVKIPTRTATGWSMDFPSGTEMAHHFSLPSPLYCPKENRPDDGRYVINGDSTVVDNFPPFVERVQIFTQGELLYDRWWDCIDDTGIYLESSNAVVTQIDHDYLGQYGFFIVATTSELLPQLKLEIPGVYPITSTSATPNTYDYTFEVPLNGDIHLDELIQLKFSAEDIGDNKLLNLLGFSDHDTPDNPITIPNAAGSGWNNPDSIPQGIDSLHRIQIVCGQRPEKSGVVRLEVIGGGNCFDVTADIQKSAADANTGSIDLDISGGIGTQGYLWSNGATEQDIQELAAGQYCITITDQLCCSQTFCFDVGVCPSLTINNPQITQPSTCNSSDGEIWFRYGPPASGGVSPYSLTWSNTTTSTIQNSGLSSGVYYLTVTDMEGCTATASYNLLSDGTPMVEVWATPGCAGMSNGEVEAFGYTTDGIGEMEYQWSTGQTTDLITNLAPGTYTVTVTNTDNGCATTASIVLEAYEESSPLAVSADVTNTTCLQPTGSIDLTVTGGVFPYTFLWQSDGGYVSTSDDLEGLPPDKYFVKVTDYCGTVVEDVYGVGECELDAEIVLKEKKNTSTYYNIAGGLEYNNDGHLKVEVEGVSDEYFYLWNTGSTSNSISGLGLGIYTVTVTDASGCCLTAAYTIESCPVGVNTSFNVKIRGGLITENENQITLDALISLAGSSYTTNIPDDYLVSWQVGNENIAGSPHSITIDIADLDLSDLPEVVLRVDSGCASKSVSKYLINCDDSSSNTVLGDFFITPVVTPCAGFFDGVIDINIPVTNVQNLIVTFNGIDYSGSPQGEDYSISIGGLAPGTYPVEITIDGCGFSFSYNLASRPFDNRSLVYDEDAQECRYSQYCGSIPVGTNTTNPFYDFELGWTCKVPIFCGETRVSDEKMKRLTLSGIEYYYLLNEIINSGNPSGLYYQAQDKLDIFSSTYNYCDRLKVCPVTLAVTSHSVSEQSVGSETDSNGCIHLDCPGLSAAGIANIINFSSVDTELCPEDTPELISDTYGDFTDLDSAPGNPCVPTTQKLGVLKYYYEQGYFDSNSEFNFNTSVFGLKFLLENNAQDDKLCYDVTYCTSNYRVTNVTEIECGVPTTSGDCFVRETTVFGEPEYTLSCPKAALGIIDGACDIKYGPNIIFNGIIPDNKDNPNCFEKMIVGNNDREELKDLLFTTVENGVVLPKGIVKTSNKTFLYDFKGGGQGKIHKTEMPDVTHMLDDWNKDEVIYTEEVMEGGKYNLVFSDTISDWQMALESNDKLTINHLSREADYIELAGTVTGILQYNGTSLLQAMTPSAFDLKIGLDGQVLSHKTIENINPNEKVIFSKNNNQELMIFGRYVDESLEIEGTTVDFNEANGCFIGNVGSNNQVNVLSALSGSESMKMLSAKYQKTGGSSVVFKTNDAVPIKLDDDVVISQQDNKIVVLSLNADGSFKWSQSFDADRINQDKIAISYDADDNLLLGLTFNRGFYFQGQEFVSEGGEDILLMRLQNETGEMDWYETYGSTDDENVSQLFFTENALVFGGEMSFSQGTRGEERSIGSSCFYNATNSTQKAYMTHVMLPRKAKDPKEKSFVANTQNNNTGINWMVYPNPFNNSVNVKVSSTTDEEAELVLYDVYGRRILTFKQDLYIGANTFSFEIKESLPAGVYLLRIKTGEGDAVWKLNHF